MSNIRNENIDKCSCKSGRQRRFLIPALLLLLSEKSSYGYDLMEKYAEFGFTEASSDPGAIYRTLKLLKSSGLVKSKLEANKPGAVKKVYSITDSGLKMLFKWVEEIKEMKKILDFFLERYSKLK